MILGTFWSRVVTRGLGTGHGVRIGGGLLISPLVLIEHALNVSGKEQERRSCSREKKIKIPRIQEKLRCRGQVPSERGSSFVLCPFCECQVPLTRLSMPPAESDRHGKTFSSEG